MVSLDGYHMNEDSYIEKDDHFFSLMDNLIKGISRSSFAKGGSDAKCTNIITRILCCLLYLVFTGTVDYYQIFGGNS